MGAIEKGQLVLNSAYILIGLAIFITFHMLMAEQESRAAQENLAELRDRKASSRLVKLLRPYFTQYIVPKIRGKKFWENRRKVIKRKLIAAGLKDELTPDEFISYKLLLIIFFPVLGVLLNMGGFLDLAWYYIITASFVGWFYPDFWVSQNIKLRQRKVLLAMPFIVDLLALSTEAGLDFVGAIGKVVEKAKPSPLIEEFAQLLKEIKVGSSRQEGLREMAFRISMSEISSFVAILISADQMGASIGKILRQQSEQIRNERMIRAEKAGARAGQMVLLPTAMFLLPAVVLMILGPFILSFIYPNGAS
jgi:tight adherence protein C